jgi:hypothetical protein
VLVATIIVGLAVAALMVSTASGSRTNDAGRKLTEATFLAQEIREWTLKLPFSDPNPTDANNPPGPDGTSPQVFVDDLDDLKSVTFSPPRDGTGTAINTLPGWSQTIQITWRNPNNLTTNAAEGASNLVYVDVQIGWHDDLILQTGWLVGRK